jgi:arabinogalactan oligomer/maltooligosaccharide transport system substrate-binding protein
LGDYTDIAVGGMTVNGKVYGVPETIKGVAMFYNKDLVKAPPKTTDELLAAIKSGVNGGMSFGCYHNWGFFNAYGGKVFDDQFQFLTDQGTGMADAMTFLKASFDALKANNMLFKSDQDATPPFKEGKLGFILNGNWMLADYQTALGDKLGVAPLPAGPKGPASPLVGVDGFYINPNSTNKEAAIKLALYLTNAASQKVMMDGAGHVPVRKDVQISNELVKAFYDALGAGTIRPQDAQMGKYWSNFCGTDDVYEKGIAPAEWVAKGTEGAKK